MKRLLLLAVLMLAACGDTDSPGESYRLTYNPPDSLFFNAEVTTLTYRIRGADTSVDSSWTMTSHILLADPVGYRITSVTDSVNFSRDGASIEDPIVDLFANGEFTHLVDSSGRVTDIQGYDTLFALLDSVIGAENAAAVRQNVSPAVLKDREMKEWNDRYDRFADRDLFIGQAEYDTTRIALPTGGSLKNYEISELADTVRRDGNLCAVIRTFNHSNPRSLAEMAGGNPQDVFEAFGISDSLAESIDSQNIESLGTSEWIVALNNMLGYSYEQTRELSFSFPGPGGEEIKGKLVDIKRKKQMYP